MVKRPGLSILGLFFTQLLQGYFLFDSLVPLQEVAGTNKVLEVLGLDSAGQCQAFDFGFANNCFGNDFKNSFGGLGVVVDWHHSFLMGFVLPGVAQLLCIMLPLVHVEQGVLVIRLLGQWLDVRFPCSELG